MECPSCHTPVDGSQRFCPVCGTGLNADPPDVPPVDPLLGTVLHGKYKIVRLLGEGGMGAVYLGEQQLGTNVRKVAIKTLHAHLSKDPKILARFEREGMRAIALRVMTMTRELADLHYVEHLDAPFYGGLADFITSGPLVAAVVEGDRAIPAFRQLAGGTDPVEKAAPGSIRGDLALATQLNIVHGSDAPESAAREIGLWFPELG